MSKKKDKEAKEWEEFLKLFAKFIQETECEPDETQAVRVQS